MPNFAKIWEWTIKAAVAIVVEVAVILIGNLDGYCTSLQIPCWAFVTLLSIVLFLILLTIFHLVWIFIAKLIRKNKRNNILGWVQIEFEKWNPKFNDITPAIGGIEITNNGEQKISSCYAELITIFEEHDGEYIDVYGNMKRVCFK